MELTVEEIIEEYRNNANPVLEGPLNCLPKSVVGSASALVSVNPEKSIKYILSAFYIYRATVCSVLYAPHYMKDAVYEWPEPAYFGWDDVDSIILFGNEIERPTNQITFSRIQDGKVITRTIDGSSTMRDLVSSRDELHKFFKYKIDNINKVMPVWSNDWQNSSLTRYVNPLFHLSRNMNIDKLKLFLQGINING